MIESQTSHQMIMEMMTTMIRILSQHGGCVSHCPILATKQNIHSFLITAKHISSITLKVFVPIVYIYNSKFLSTQDFCGAICFIVQGESKFGCLINMLNTVDVKCQLWLKISKNPHLDIIFSGTYCYLDFFYL